MSAAFKISKKKVPQSELRKVLNEHKNKQKDIKKIESPLAKYNELGQLTCVLCKSIVRSEAVWTVHINAKVHKQNVEIAKKLKERTNNFTAPIKRPLTPPTVDNIPEKKIKGILKKTNTSSHDVYATHKLDNNNRPDGLPEITNSQNVNSAENSDDKTTEVMETGDMLEGKDILPEGFFDDPKLDAKARNQEYKDPVEDEWEKFLKAIKEADNQSNAIIAEDQEEATIERQIVEIDEQMKKLSKVLDLEKKKIGLKSISNENKNIEKIEKDDEEPDDNFDEFLDWRAKKSFK